MENNGNNRKKKASENSDEHQAKRSRHTERDNAVEEVFWIMNYSKTIIISTVK